jgi:hypothetical protein
MDLESPGRNRGPFYQYDRGMERCAAFACEIPQMPGNEKFLWPQDNQKIMVNIAILIGTGYFGEDILHKLSWARLLDPPHTFFWYSRINPDIHLNDSARKYLGNDLSDTVKEQLKEVSQYPGYHFIYTANHFGKKYSESEIIDLQNWLGISFSFLGSLDRRFYNKDSRSDSRNTKELNHYMAGLVEIFRDRFTENEIEFLVNTLEDDIFSTIAYYTAVKLKIPTIGLMTGRFNQPGLMICHNFTDIIEWNRESVTCIENVKRDDSLIIGKSTMDRTINSLRVTTMTKRFFSSYRNYVKSYKTILDSYPYESNILEKTTFFSEIKKYCTRIGRKSLIKWYRRDIDERDNFFLFPLHYEQDAQITFREPLIDQVQLIFDISRSLPCGYSLYVKPHPHYLATDISTKKMREISTLENVKIIDPSIPPGQLIRRSKGIITINSTTGFESLMMNIPVMSFGHDFYCKDDVLYLIRDKNILPGTLSKMITDQNIPFTENISIFIKTIVNNTIWLSDPSAHPPYLIISDKDAKKIAFAINSWINQYSGLLPDKTYL